MQGIFTVNILLKIIFVILKSRYFLELSLVLLPRDGSVRFLLNSPRALREASNLEQPLL
jgi:hypothetical protein